MKFITIPLLDEMITLYAKPRDPQVRFFDGYLTLIQTPDKKNMQRAIPFFNPMGKSHISDMLDEMKTMGFEEIFATACTGESDEKDVPILQTFRNLADDIAGGWTDKEQTIEISKKIRPFIKRGFCVIVFFTSEDITSELIYERVKEYTELYRNFTDPKPE